MTDNRVAAVITFRKSLGFSRCTVILSMDHADVLISSWHQTTASMSMEGPSNQAV